MQLPLVEQTLIFDADDTLWECNKYFEQSIAEFIDVLETEHLTRDEIRQVLDTFERTNGYGARAFARSLVDTWRHLATENDPGDDERVESLGLRILEQPMETIDGVIPTLTALQDHHTLLLFTKGEEEEQRVKIARSEVGNFFDMHIVTHDKTPDTYEEVVESLGLEKSTCWMIGNSQKSDIQPALEAGINAIYIPNPHTWHMEFLDFAHHHDWGSRYLELETIQDMVKHFHAS